jgi:gamma-glutamyl:cysteine ligase YbdK (ATP-grasp superfamily)
LNPSPLHLFQGTGVELEYMIVDRESLAVRPLADRVLHEIAGAYESEVEVGTLRWSNELVLHVIELKTNGPAASLDPLPALFHEHVVRINRILEPLGACLMPTAMHPWMDPLAETVLWPHEYSPVYETFNSIFNCQGHGWANLQSVHLNLPFANDEEFARLHAAIRLVLPILPALAASSPIVEGRATGILDSRLEAYRLNARRIPSVTGQVIPEAVFSRDEYETRILNRMYEDIAPFDPDGILQYEWLNARGAIARFDRNTIEVRVLDVQECPRADLAIVAAIIAVLRALVAERWTGLARQQAWQAEPLAKIFLECVRKADAALIRDTSYLEMFGLTDAPYRTAGDLWRHLVGAVSPLDADRAWRPALEVLLEKGPLARRILEAAGPAGPSREGDPADPESIRAAYRSLCRCLAENCLFPAPELHPKCAR